ncbi:MAG: ABC transporter substrate-binding protein [Nitrospinota bacterium]
MKKRCALLALIFTITWVFPFTVPPSQAQTKKPIVVMLDWAFGGKHSPFFIAIEKGSYRKKGISLKLERGYGGGKSILAVDQGLAKFCMEDTIMTVMARSKGSTIKLIGMLAERSPAGFASLKEKPLTKPKDLEGTKLAMTAFTTQRQLIPVFARINRLALDKIKVITMDGGVHIPALVRGDVDVVATWKGANLPPFRLAARKQGKELVFLGMSDWGLDIYSLGLMASEQTIRETPDLVRNFLEATYRGVEHAVKNPKEAVDALLKRHPEVSPAIARGQWDESVELLRSKPRQMTGFGWIDRKKMQFTIDTIVSAFNVKKVPTPEEVYTNAFLPQKR